ncbi:hypothetical protein [Terricaulis sp.]|uniref:hypothetical protein n=1 Tax=Terricaulis sp. TaxID=2768686 RepID=UPI003784E271
MNANSPPRVTARGRTVTAAAIYFALVFAVGLLLGPVRVLWLEPLLGKTLAVACEAPLLVLAMHFAATAALRWTGLEGGWIRHLGVGLIALAFQQTADLAVGFGLRGMTLQEQLANFTTPPGWIYAFTLIVFAFAPLVAYFRARRAEAQRLARNQAPLQPPR